MSLSARMSGIARLWQSRKASLMLFAGTLGALLVAAIWFTSARSDLAQAYAKVGSKHQALAATQQRKQEARLRVQMATGAAELVRRAETGGYTEDGWGERLINISQSPLGRNDVNDLLDGVSRDQSRIFGADDFELSVTRIDEGLFDPPGPRSPPLMLTLRGTLLFRIRQAALPLLPPTTTPEAP